MGCVYILTNPAFKENWVKIGMSSRDVDVRAKELDNTAVPLPFEIYATLETKYFTKAEHHIHKMLDLVTETRIRKSREFFNISPEKALEILYCVKDLLPDGIIKKVGAATAEAPATTDPIKTTEETKPIKPVKPIEVKSSNSWIIPANKAFFDLEGCFNNLGGVYWKQKHNFQVGDIIYVYSSRPDKCLKYKCHVEKSCLGYNEEMEVQKKYDKGNGYLSKDSIYSYIKFDKKLNSSKLGYDKLKENGLKGTMISGVKCAEKLAIFIESIL